MVEIVAHDGQTCLWPLRSLLFVPGNKIAWLQKVKAHAPDAVILDLEDAVPPAEKAAARREARNGVKILNQLAIAAFVRINPLDELGLADIEAVVCDGLAGVLLPKTRSADDIHLLDVALAHAEGRAGLRLRSIAVLPVPETTQALLDMRSIACASPRVMGMIGLVGGAISGDFARAAGFRPTNEGFEQLHLASKTVLESLGGNAPFPLATIIGTNLKDLDAVRRLAHRAKAIGFTGAVVIYPPHAAIANEVFTPSAAEIDYAEGLLEAFNGARAQGQGTISYRGQMIDRAMVPEAEAIVREARRRGLAAP